MKKKLKQILSVLLVAVMLVCIAPVGGIDFTPKAKAMDLSSYKVGDLIEFGSYPQSEVKDLKTIKELDNVWKNWQSYGYYSGTGNANDGKMTSSNYMQYADMVYNGTKYRAVQFMRYRPYNTCLGSSDLYSYQYDNGYYTGNTYYFKYEPLLWRILDPSEGYVMCNNIIDAQTYQNFCYHNGYELYNSVSCTNYATDWETSSLRIWLNNDFYNTAFTMSEKAQIGLSYLENESTQSNKYNSKDTIDRIFVISYYDARNSIYGFISSEGYSDTIKQKKERIMRDVRVWRMILFTTKAIPHGGCVHQVAMIVQQLFLKAVVRLKFIFAVSIAPIPALFQLSNSIQNLQFPNLSLPLLTIRRFVLRTERVSIFVLH